MIGTVLQYIRSTLDAHVTTVMGDGSITPNAEKVVFADASRTDVLSFKSDAVTMLLLGVEEERTHRAPDPYVRNVNGTTVRVQPDLPLALSLFLVAQFKNLDVAWEHLSAVIDFFRAHRELETTAPAPANDVTRLQFELIPMRFSEQNEIWSALRAAHHPSVLYRVRMVVLRDRASAEQSPKTELIQIQLQPTKSNNLTAQGQKPDE
jgi:hypothetical protein